MCIEQDFWAFSNISEEAEDSEMKILPSQNNLLALEVAEGDS